MAKSVLDAGWYLLKTQLDYKSKGMQAEAYTSQVCSYCGASRHSPKRRAGLGIKRMALYSVWDIKHLQEESPSFREGRMSTLSFSYQPLCDIFGSYSYAHHTPLASCANQCAQLGHANTHFFFQMG